MATRECRNLPDSFCYVCGFYVGPKYVSHKIVKGAKFWIAYRLYFGMSMGDEEKPWVPHVICEKLSVKFRCMAERCKKSYTICCAESLEREKNYHDDCYFCMIDISKYRKVKGRKSLPYPSLPSSIAPVPHYDTLPIPRPPENVSI